MNFSFSNKNDNLPERESHSLNNSINKNINKFIEIRDENIISTNLTISNLFFQVKKFANSEKEKEEIGPKNDKKDINKIEIKNILSKKRTPFKIKRKPEIDYKNGEKNLESENVLNKKPNTYESNINFNKDLFSLKSNLNVKKKEISSFNSNFKIHENVNNNNNKDNHNYIMNNGNIYNKNLLCIQRDYNLISEKEKNNYYYDNKNNININICNNNKNNINLINERSKLNYIKMISFLNNNNIDKQNMIKEICKRISKMNYRNTNNNNEIYGNGNLNENGSFLDELFLDLNQRKINANTTDLLNKGNNHNNYIEYNNKNINDNENLYDYHNHNDYEIINCINDNKDLNIFNDFDLINKSSEEKKLLNNTKINNINYNYNNNTCKSKFTKNYYNKNSNRNTNSNSINNNINNINKNNKNFKKNNPKIFFNNKINLFEKNVDNEINLIKKNLELELNENENENNNNNNDNDNNKKKNFNLNNIKISNNFLNELININETNINDLNKNLLSFKLEIFSLINIINNYFEEFKIDKQNNQQAMNFLNKLNYLLCYFIKFFK
jgi:hypothetical protein